MQEATDPLGRVIAGAVAPLEAAGPWVGAVGPMALDCEGPAKDGIVTNFQEEVIRATFSVNLFIIYINSLSLAYKKQRSVYRYQILTLYVCIRVEGE